MRAREFISSSTDLLEIAGVLRKGANLFRNIGRDPNPDITMYTNPEYRGSMATNPQGLDIKSIPVTQVDISKLEPWEPVSKMRDTSSQTRLYGLVNAIQQGKPVPPILVTPIRGGYRIIDGHHRYTAYQSLGAKSVPVRIIDPKKIRYSDEIIKNSLDENFADGKVKGRSRPGRVKRAGASCKGSVTDLRARARKYGGEKGKMYHWCANMKSGRQKK